MRNEILMTKICLSFECFVMRKILLISKAIKLRGSIGERREKYVIMFVIDERRNTQIADRSIPQASLTFLFRYYAPRRRALFVLLTYTLRLVFFFSLPLVFFLHAMTLLLFVGQKNAVVTLSRCIDKKNVSSSRHFQSILF